MTQNKTELLEAYDLMSKIRAFEDRIHVENTKGDIPGFIHLYSGEEAIAVGVCQNLTHEDYISSTHRGHGHCIAKGCDITSMMYEIFGRKEGLCHGKGGSMHIADLSVGMLGANGIVGSGPSIAIGAALTAKYRGDGNVAVSFTGDGGSNQGMVFEAMNMAVVLELPIVFVFENNHVGEATGADFSVGSHDISARAGSFGMPSVKVDGTDYFAVYDAAHKAVERARKGEGPSVIEAEAWRFYGHFEGDQALYRTPEQLDTIKADHDPLQVFRQKMPRTLKKEQLDQVDIDNVNLVDEAVAEARAAELPPASDVLTNVYVSY